MVQEVKKHKLLKTCFYCESVFSTSRSAQGDHMPIPRRYEGDLTVPCCKTCHEAKDNINLENWSNEMWMNVIADFPKLSRDTRLFLAKAMAVCQDALHDLDRRAA